MFKKTTLAVAAAALLGTAAISSGAYAFDSATMRDHRVEPMRAHHVVLHRMELHRVPIRHDVRFRSDHVTIPTDR
jgi:hypothetical protein